MRRRLDLASALMHRPQLLILDEPTEGLDPQSHGALWEELERTRRWSILAAEMVPLFFQAAAMPGVLLLIALLLGATIVTGVAGFVAIMLLAGYFGLALPGISFVPALLTKSEQATSTFSLLLFPVVFMSTAFVPAELMPDWMRVVNDWNPIIYLIEAIRAIMVTGFDWPLIGQALLSLTVIGVLLQAATLWAFGRLAR